MRAPTITNIQDQAFRDPNAQFPTKITGIDRSLEPVTIDGHMNVKYGKIQSAFHCTAVKPPAIALMRTKPKELLVTQIPQAALTYYRAHAKSPSLDPSPKPTQIQELV